jgi:ketosteroid isomerase-like protein
MNRPKLPDATLHATSDDTEQQFYEALQRGDVDKLMGVWADEDDITCVHPGGPRIVGPAAIRAAFDAMFSNGAISVHPEKVRRVVTHASAVHSVVERIEVMTDEGPQTAWVLATNVYMKGALGWRLVAHHASPGSTEELPEIGETPSVLH